jgi:glutamate-ammonia-ligase adenylyltransferase
MGRNDRRNTRKEALKRARAHSPFLRDAALVHEHVVDTFLEEGSVKATELALSATGDGLDSRLRRQRQGLALSVALGDLAGEFNLERVTLLLSDFADQAIDEAVRAAILERMPDGEPQGFAVIAMGKLGSRELNYSSDVDLLLLFEPEALPKRRREDAGDAAVRIGRRLIEALQKRTEDGYVQRVDLRLRPSPEVTPIALPINAALSHYESSALPWERAAFIRARAAAGDITLGQRFLDAIQPFVWRRSLDFGVIEEVRQISSRIRDHFAQGANIGPGYDLKRGRGGIREVEFFVQIQQMIHGGRDSDVRAPATLDAIGQLLTADRIDENVASELSDSYRLLRTVEHRVQMIDDAQTHLLPTEAAALDNVAQLDGLPDGEALIALLRPHVERAGTIFDGLAPDESRRLSGDPDILAEELASLGFSDTAAARHIADWRSGKARSLRSPPAQQAFEAMLPELLRAIAASADPNHALNRLGDIVERLSSGVNFFRLLEARPALAQLLAKVLAHAPALADQLGRRPELFEGLFDASCFAMPPPAAEFAGLLSDAMRGHAYDVALDRARRLVNERRFALGVQLIDRHRDPLEVTEGYARVAEGTLLALGKAAAAEFAETHGTFDEGELLVLALGRFGGHSLTHASDLDVIYLHTAPPNTPSNGPKPLGPNDYFNRLASRVTAAMSVPTAAGPLYDVDARLRPGGAKGMLVVSLDAFEQYQREEAWTWEHMALCRARPIFGSKAARDQTSSVIRDILCLNRDTTKIIADATKMRADMERHKPPLGALDVKLGPGGLVDLEFAVHVLQLTRQVGLSTRLEVALEELATESLVQANIVEALKLLSRMLVMMRLVAPGDIKPTGETWQLVAEACGANSWDELLAEHDAARQSIAALWNSIKQEAAT